MRPASECPPSFASLVPVRDPVLAAEPVHVERISAGVPWPRGLAFVEGRLVALARGRHRRAGGVDHALEDSAGTLFWIDPRIAEPLVPGVPAGAAVERNAIALAVPPGWPFRLPERGLQPADDVWMDRPYCTLIHDPVSRNLFVCGYSGVDLPSGQFRKNATDSVLRFDLRSMSWYPVERHDPGVVPLEQLGASVPNEHYPHHAPALAAPPHGWLNGPAGGCVAGSFLYCVAKDNHLVVQYDLQRIRADPDACFPASRPVLGPSVSVRSPSGTHTLEVLGPSAAAAWEGHLYVAYRTSSVVLRFPLAPDGDLVRAGPGERISGELIAVFEPWDEATQRSADLVDIAFDTQGRLFAACARAGRVWQIGRPDPARPFHGDDRSARPTSAPPFVDLDRLSGLRTSCANIVFDAEDRLYVCVGNRDNASSALQGAIYRVSRTDSRAP